MGIAGDTGLGGTQHPRLLVEQEAFALETTGVTGELAAATDDAMARTMMQSGLRALAAATARTAVGRPRASAISE